MKEVKGKGFCQIEPEAESNNEAALLLSFGIKFQDIKTIDSMIINLSSGFK